MKSSHSFDHVTGNFCFALRRDQPSSSSLRKRLFTAARKFSVFISKGVLAAASSFATMMGVMLSFCFPWWPEIGKHRTRLQIIISFFGQPLASTSQAFPQDKGHPRTEDQNMKKTCTKWRPRKASQAFPQDKGHPRKIKIWRKKLTKILLEILYNIIFRNLFRS